MDQPPRPRTFRALFEFGGRMIIPVVLFLWGLWSVPLALFGPDRNMVPDDRGIARLNIFVLEQFHVHLDRSTGDHQDARFMFPQKNAMAYVDGLVGTAPIYVLFRQFGAERETAYQFWMLALFALTYWCCFIACMVLTKRTWLAACGAFLFAFGLHVLVHLGHTELLPCFFMPLALALLWWWLATARALHIILAAIATAMQFYCSSTMGWTLLLGLIILSVAHVLIYRRSAAWIKLPRRMVFLQAGSALLLTTILLTPLLLEHIRSEAVDPVPLFEENTGVLTLSSLFHAPAAALSWQDLTRPGPVDAPGHSQPALFMGGVPWLTLVVAAILLWRQRLPAERRSAVATMCVAWCLSVGIAMLPVASGVLPHDGVVYLLAFFAMGMIVLVTDHLAGQGKWWALGAMVLLPALLVVDGRFDPNRTERFDKHASRATIAQVRTHLQGRERVAAQALAYAPVLPVGPERSSNEARVVSTLSAMLAAQELSVPLVNAYADRLPQEFIRFFQHPDRDALQQWCSFSGCDIGKIQWRDNVGLPIRQVERVRLMAHDGRYLCADADRYGAFALDRPEAEQWQSFVLVHLMDGRTGIMVHSGRWAWAETYKHGSLLGDSPELGDLGLFRVERDNAGRMAFRCADGQYITAQSDGSLSAASDTLMPATWFSPAPLPDGYH